MAQEEVDRIKEKFSELNLNAEYLEHKAVLTSEDAARTRGFELKQGIKAMLFTNGTDFVLVDVPAGKTRMATPEEVLEKTGCEIGSVPPLGHKNKIKILVDNQVFDNEVSDFNIGLLTVSAKIPTLDVRKAFEDAEAVFGEFIRE
jgi:Ala-tRNA(Pro) deacylase